MACMRTSKCFDAANWTLATHFFLTFDVNRSIYLLLNLNLNDILRKMCQKSRDEGKEKEI